MEILASCSYEESLNYNGKLYIENEEGTQDKVSLNIVMENDDTSVIDNIKPSVKCITYLCDIEDLDIPEGLVFREYSLEEVKENGIKSIKGVTPLLKVPKDYSNMLELYKLCEANKNLRVYGGLLLNIEGVRIGRYSKGKDKGSPVYEGVYDTFLEMSLSDIGKPSELIKKARKRISDVNETSATKGIKQKKSVARVSNISKSFTSLFSDVEEEEF